MKNNHFHDLNGEQKDQLLIVVDRNGKRLGTASREECHKGDGKTHLAFMALVEDKEGKIVLTRRSGKKSLWGGFWDASVVSHVLSNETPEIAAKRRGKEELGVEIDFQDLGAFYYFAKYGGNCENEYCHVLVGKTNETVDFNPVEIDEIKKITLIQLIREITNSPDKFTPWLKIALNKINLDKIKLERYFVKDYGSKI